MVWGGITHEGKTDLVIVDGNINGQRYRDEIIIPHVIPFLAANGPGMVFQQDNAQPHIANVVKNHLQLHHVDVMPWPAISPDITPIEHVWEELERRLRKRPNQARTVPELALALREEWTNMPQGTIQRVIGSMRRRCQAVILVEGGHTSY